MYVVVECEFSVWLWSKPFPSGLSFGLGPSRTTVIEKHLYVCFHWHYWSWLPICHPILRPPPHSPSTCNWQCETKKSDELCSPKVHPLRSSVLRPRKPRRLKATAMATGRPGPWRGSPSKRPGVWRGCTSMRQDRRSRRRWRDYLSIPFAALLLYCFTALLWPKSLLNT